jgi:archaellum component FlaC
MRQLESIPTITDDLPHFLNELSLSYSLLYSAEDSLEELEKAVKELKELVVYLKGEISKI